MVNALVGRLEPDGALNVVAAEREPSHDFIRRGKIYNPDKMATCIKNLVNRLENRLDKKIAQMYVGIGGMGLHSVKNTITQKYDENTKITQEIVDSIMETNRSHEIQCYRILDVIPPEYHMGTMMQLEPVGVMTQQIEGHFLNLVIPPTADTMIDTSFKTAGMTIADTLKVNVLPLADMVLTDSEKRSGCVLIDMGAETTTVAVYNGGKMRFLSVIPLGGQSVTNDLATILRIPETEAEGLKRQYGMAYIDPKEERETDNETIHLSGGNTETRCNIEYMIEDRVSEILQNVNKQIELAQETDDLKELLGGIIVTGGCAKMANMTEALVHYTKINKVRVVTVPPVTIRCDASFDFVKDGRANSALALLTVCQEDCCTEKSDEGNDIFSRGEQQKQEEEARKKASANVKNMVERINCYFEDFEEFCKNREKDDAQSILETIKGLHMEIQAQVKDLFEDDDARVLAVETADAIEEAEKKLENLNTKPAGGWFSKLIEKVMNMFNDLDD